jgi:PDZ domain-containing protein
LIPYDRFRVSRRTFAVIPVAAFLVALLAVPLPYYGESPGPTRDVQPLIHVSGPTLYRSDGKFVMTSVSFLPLTVARLLRAWQDPAQGVVPESVLVFPGETQEHADQRSMSQMDQSKIDATTVVLGLLKDYPESHGPGVLVESVSPVCPADGLLFPGDLIERVNGREISDPEAFDRLLKKIPPSRPLVLRVSAGGETTDVRLTRERCDPGSKRFLIGISTVANFPFEVSISSGDIGGPSAGTMFALGLYDLLTPGDLTGGRTVAGTGTIDNQGRVGEIGGVEEKVAAAKEIGADVFLVPDGNLAAARTVAGDLELVPMATFQDALDYLERSA